MANEGIVSGEDVGMILLDKEIQILNLRKQMMVLQQRNDALAAALVPNVPLEVKTEKKA